MCAHSPFVQPLPQPVIPKDRINSASLLPRQLWIEVLSYTRRDWFEQAPTAEDVLRRQLLQQFQLDNEEDSEEESEEENNMDAESQHSDAMEEGEDADAGSVMDIAPQDTSQNHVRPARSVSFASGEA